MRGLVRIAEDQRGKLYSIHDANLNNAPFYWGESKLVYDSETKVVYWCYSEHLSRGRMFDPPVEYTGYMSPYISENGKFCRFIDNKLVEIG